MRISNPFRYYLREPYPSCSCVFKVWFGKKFFIWKAKALHQSVNNMSIEIDRRLRLGTKDGDIYEKIVKYIRKARVSQFDVEMLLANDNPVELLEYEYKELKKAEKNEDCLNISFAPVCPKWIPETACTEFDQWRQNINKKKREKKNATKNTKAVPAGRSGGKKGSVPDAKRGTTGVRRKAQDTGAVKEKPKADCNKPQKR